MNSEIKNNGFQSPIESGGPEETALSRDYSLLRNGAGPIQNLMDGTLRIEDLTCGASSGSLEAVVATAEPGVSCWEGKATDGGKWYHMLEGTLEVVANNISHILSEGDSLYLESTIPHIWRNSGDRTAKILVLSSPPPMAADQTGLVA